MAKTKSQRMKEYRERKKALLGDEWLRRENQRVKGYFVPISELPLRKQEHKRELNKKHAQTYRKKLKLDIDNTDRSSKTEEHRVLTPEPSTTQGSNEVSSTTNIPNPLIVKIPFTSKESSRESRGRKRISRALAKQYRKNETLKDQNEELKRKLNTVTKRLNRLKHKQLTTPEPSTPKSKSYSLLRKAGLDPTLPSVSKLRQKVLFAECVGDEIKAASQSNQKQVVMRIVTGKIIKKYKLKTSLASTTGLNRRKMNNVQKSVSLSKRSRNKAISEKIDKDIQNFLERDDNSRLLPGKADAVKVGKDKVQKRVLNDYMYNLHTKFLAESSYKISHATFCRKKPTSIAHVNFSSRSVCLCQKHQNFALKLRCLKNYKVSTVTSPDKFMDTYNTEEKLSTLLQGINMTTIRYQEWKRKKMSDGKERMRVVDLELPRGEFIEVMTKTYKDFASHIHKVIEQYKGLKHMKERLPVNHVLIQMDFSENYTCQSLEEIQSAYWNATAITLHPTVIYRKDENGKLFHDSIVFVSEVLQHNASMVLAIIKKVVEHVKKSDSNVKGMHFWTDSPTSQYRNKTMFDIISRLKVEYGIMGSWHYFESGHGKGPCDGVGGTTKRNADNAIKQGKTIIQDADDFFRWAKETNSQIEYQQISQEEFNQCKEIVDKRNLDLKAIKGTMKIHSVIGISAESILTRETICVCDDCFKSDGFNESTKCQWEKHCLFKPKNTCITETVVLPQEIEDNEDQVTPNSENPSDQIETTVSNINEGDYVVFTYEMKGYIGKVMSVDESDNEIDVTCMEACGKTEGRYKWPRKEDRIWIPKSSILKKINEPKATGKSRRMFNVDPDTISFMNALV